MPSPATSSRTEAGTKITAPQRLRKLAEERHVKTEVLLGRGGPAGPLPGARRWST
jgi:hypothetical protein